MQGLILVVHSSKSWFAQKAHGPASFFFLMGGGVDGSGRTLPAASVFCHAQIYPEETPASLIWLGSGPPRDGSV